MKIGKLYKTNCEIVVGGSSGGWLAKGTIFTVIEKYNRQYRILTATGSILCMPCDLDCIEEVKAEQ